MKVVSSSDWRDALPFETPLLVADVAPGEPTRCATCGTSADPIPRERLWAVKHRHPNNHTGYLRFYCADHVPAAKVPEPPAPTRRTIAQRERSAATPTRRAEPVVEKPRAVCPDCFIEVSATGRCGMCGALIA
ncbi:glucose-6-phosphate dehydrogenase [Microbacterium sp. 18062]|uniref:glucose-6-phosphate dehydrogenase n=1 Tax=Microbacterium sp. 18062 TaxID=2681410 RepID=UPI00135CC11E|nr:glucose-6-phosphate dehydrogenase [Microbacterium sp. 18062]